MRVSSQQCPCCGQLMPKTNFKLYPKSAAVIRNGVVQLLGPVQFHMLTMLYKAYPEPVPTARLLSAAYDGTRNYSAHRKNVSASLHYLRRRLAKMNVNIHNCWGSYQLKIDPMKGDAR